MDLERIYKEISEKIAMMDETEITNLNKALRYANSKPYILDHFKIAHQDITHNVSYSTVNKYSRVGINKERNTLNSSNATYDIKVRDNDYYCEENKVIGKDNFKVSA